MRKQGVYHWLKQFGDGGLSEPANEYNPITWAEEDPQWILFRLTAAEFKEILSALITGATVVYPEKSHAVVWHFLRDVEFPYMLCDLIAECIRNSIGTGNALDDALNDWWDNQQGDKPGGIPQASEDMLGLSPCDLDTLYGHCRQLVDWMDSAIRDLFEAIEAFTNFLEYWSAFADKLPILGWAVDLAEAIQDSFYDAYLLNHTEQLEVEYACDLFCIALSHDCKLTWEDVELYFAEKMQFDPNDTLRILVQIMLTGTFSAEEYVAMFYHLLAVVVYKGGTWIGLDLDAITGLMQSFANDPDPDWEFVCDTCGAWRATYDYVLDDCNFVIPTFGGNPSAVYDPGNGYRATNWIEPGQQEKVTRCLIQLPITSDVEITRAEITVPEWTSGGGFNNGEWIVAFANQYSEPLVSHPTSGQGDHARSYNLELSSLGNTVDVRCTNRNRYGGAALVSKLVIWGTGEPPDEIVDNATEFTYITS